MSFLFVLFYIRIHTKLVKTNKIQLLITIKIVATNINHLHLERPKAGNTKIFVYLFLKSLTV